MYKVVVNDNGIRGSSGYPFGVFPDTEYPIGLWAYPPIGKLFVFQDKDKALWYASGLMDSEVWEINAIGVETIHAFLSYDAVMSAARLKEFWRTFDKTRLPFSIPVSSLTVASQVMLLEKIYG